MLAIEHRDGTAPSVISHFPQANVEGTQEKTPEVVFYLHPEDVTCVTCDHRAYRYLTAEWQVEGRLKASTLRVAQ